MASSKKKNSIGGVVVGPILVVAALMALWKNETRFDYHKAAAKASPAPSLSGMNPGENYSFTGGMNQDLKLSGKYVSEFTGYLFVSRSAEIYCWDRDEDDDGDVTWSRRWMSSVQSNSRNEGIDQKLTSGRILPPTYRVGELQITSEKIEFVDSQVTVEPGPLPKTQEGSSLSTEGTYLKLRKGRSDNLGDERLIFRALPVPLVATWFGRFERGEGSADVSEQKSGLINSIIQNTGVLHHLVAGERETALRTMKRHIQRVKWIVRGIGTFLVVFGMLFFFASVLRFLFMIPLIGRFAETGAFLLALIAGIPLALTTILLGFVAGNPVILIPILLLIVAGAWFLVHLSKRQRKAGEQVKRELETQYGRSLEPSEMKHLEYREMAGMLASSEAETGRQQSAALDRFARKNGIQQEEREMVQREIQENAFSPESAKTHLQNLIRLAAADAKITPQEVRSIREAATVAGYSREEFRQLMSEVSAEATSRGAA